MLLSVFWILSLPWLQILKAEGGNPTQKQQTSDSNLTCSSLFTRPGGDTVTVLQNVRPFTTLYTIVSQPSKNLTYKMSTLPPSASSLFYINPNGEILVPESGYSSKQADQTYKLAITVEEEPGGASCTGLVNINVLPVYFVNFTKKSYSASIRENTGPMALVTTVTANGVCVHYEIIDQSPSTNTFQIDEVTGEIRTTYNLDLENQSPSVKLYVRAYDPIHQVSATTLVNITVLEANDIPPFCTPAVFVDTVPETTPIGYSFFNLKCNKDQEKQTLSYKIITNANSLYKFRLQNGEFQVNNTITYDSAEMASVNFQYVASINVTDSSTVPSFSTIVNIYITVTPVNQYAPVCHPPYEFPVQMMSPINTVVGTVNATDRDWKFNNIQYSIIGGNPDPPLFYIDRHTGIIHLLNNPEYEQLRTFNLEIQIVDLNQDIEPDPKNQKTGSCAITVYMQDTNPVCKPWYYVKTICSTDSPESEVVTLYCTSTNASVSYEIVGGNTNEQFSMRGSTIFTKNAFTYYTPGVVDPTSFELLVRVTVDTASTLSATATVLVQVAYCTTTTTTTTTTTATTTRTTRIIRVMEHYWAPDPWFVAVMTVTGALLILVLSLLIWKCFKRSSLCRKPLVEESKPILRIKSSDPKGLSDLPPKPDDTLMEKSSMQSMSQQSTKFDGKAEDPVTGQQYLFNSNTGERRWM
ncbi:cadherin-related family member 4-like [Polyodon spathula]|uniref:cadherin-related family member 4-like n=1 Tax=Polyodon spathula TaxID=7913 RepID=UPI001B7F32FE|nr:cadherin-related family member 4-like [Polyodon spathula]